MASSTTHTISKMELFNLLRDNKHLDKPKKNKIVTDYVVASLKLIDNRVISNARHQVSQKFFSPFYKKLDVLRQKSTAIG